MHVAHERIGDGGKGEWMDLEKRRAQEKGREREGVKRWSCGGGEGLRGARRREVAWRRRKDKRLGGCERGACADETRSGTCGPHRSEPVHEPHTTAPFNLSTWMYRRRAFPFPSPHHRVPLVQFSLRLLFFSRRKPTLEIVS